MLNISMAFNNISTQALKRDRQLAKLELASAKRLAQGNSRPYHDITQLPTQYPETNNTHALVNNPNIGGLITGRPWIASLISSLIAYAANSITPQLVADFKGGVYGKNSALSTFDNVLNHTRNGNATMVDADGLLKWAPHNLMQNSLGLTIAGYTPTRITLSVSSGVFSVTETTESSNHRVFDASMGTVPNQTTAVFEVKANGRTKGSLLGGYATSANAADFDLTAVTITDTASNVISSGIEALADGWYRITLVYAEIQGAVILALRDDSGANSYVGDGVSGMLFRFPHTYRSDLGGMVNNPATGNSYVPTTNAAVYLPRVGNHVYNGTSYVNEGLLLESEARTNLFTYSEDWTNPGWTKSNSTIVSNAIAGPPGATTADKLVAASSNSEHAAFQAVVTDGSGFSQSCYMKAGEYDYGFIRARHNGSYKNAMFNLANGTVVVEDIPATIVSVGNGWYRCSANITSGTSGSNGVVGVSSNGTSHTSTGDGSSGIYIWGAQFELGSTSSSYIPTAGATVTRAAETLSVAAASMPDYQTPVVIGPELVTNGDFSSGSTGWTTTGTVIAGQLVLGLGADAEQTLVLVEGNVYRATVDLIAVSGNPVIRVLGESTKNTQFTPTADGTTGELIFRAGPLATGIQWVGDSNDTATIDNISVREINPLAVSIAIDGLATYADTNSSPLFSIYPPVYFDWKLDGNNRIAGYTSTDADITIFRQWSGGVSDTAQVARGLAGVNVPFNHASRHGSTFINGAVNGTALTADTTPTTIADLSTTDFDIGPNFMGSIGKVRVWPVDIGDVGIAEASS
jgi:hypothetical protein